jgi:molecular chaperone GrpE
MSRRKRKGREHDGGGLAGESHTPGSPYEAASPEVDPRDPPPAADVGGEPGDRDASGRANELDAELERLGSEASEMRDLAQRTRAEFENYRKRMERERAELVRLAGFEVVKEVLPILDNLERAIRAADASPTDQLRAGVEIIERQFKEILTRMGLAEVESQGKAFDPHLHEAVSRVETSKQPEGTIVEVFQKGYSFKDRLVRPAMVAVAQSPSSSGSSPEAPGGEDEMVRRSE